MQKDDSVPSTRIKADSGQKVEDIFGSSNDTKPNVVGSHCHGNIVKFSDEFFKSVNGELVSPNYFQSLRKKT